MIYGLKLGWRGPIEECIGFYGGPIKEYASISCDANIIRPLLITVAYFLFTRASTQLAVSPFE